MKPLIVLSGVNFTGMGPLSVMQEAVQAAADHFADTHEVVALVHRKDLFQVPGVTLLEFPEVKRSWLRRLKFEYLDVSRLSRDWNVDLWLSMHDITPTVVAKRRAVYCHNPSPFYPFRAADLRRDLGFALFTLFYRFLYRINIHANDFVVVQQDWMRNAFRRMYGLANVVVAHPAVAPRRSTTEPPAQTGSAAAVCRFFYPCYPRVFKNIEVLLDACAILAQTPDVNFEVCLTFDGSENRYAADLVNRIRHLKQVRFLGALSRDAVYEYYRSADCLVFPSKLETWGLPITEFRQFRKPMLIADLPYARETAGGCERVGFFQSDDPDQLASGMRAVAAGAFRGGYAPVAIIPEPYCPSWRELLDLLLHAPVETGSRMKGAECTASA